MIKQLNLNTKPELEFLKIHYCGHATVELDEETAAEAG